MERNAVSNPAERSHPEPMPELFEQPELPLSVHSNREVYWSKVSVEEKRRFLLGRKTVVRTITMPGSIMPQYESIPADQIHTLVDPQLRAALQLQDAAEAMGWYENAPGSKSAHFVRVSATDKGAESELVSAIFSGVKVNGVDMFMENLRRADPNYDGLYGELYNQSF